MKTYTFYEIKELKKVYLKTFFDISYHYKSEFSYRKGNTNEFVPADINELFIIVPKGFPQDTVFESFVKRPLMESYTNHPQNQFSDEATEIKPNYNFEKYNSNVCDTLNGFIFPKKYLNNDIYRFDYFEDRKPYKKRYCFAKGIDEIIIQNRYVSYENKTLVWQNN